MNYFLDAIKKYADFTGRARRQEYWMFFLFYVLFYIGAVIVDGILGTFIISLLFSLALLIPSLAIGARRLHDTGRTGWWLLIGLVPLIGGIVLLVFFIFDSVEDNQYGPNPKAVPLA